MQGFRTSRTEGEHKSRNRVYSCFAPQVNVKHSGSQLCSFSTAEDTPFRTQYSLILLCHVSEGFTFLSDEVMWGKLHFKLENSSLQKVKVYICNLVMICFYSETDIFHISFYILSTIFKLKKKTAHKIFSVSVPHAADKCPLLFTTSLAIIVYKAATLCQPLLMVSCFLSSCLSCRGWCVYFPDSQAVFFRGNVDRVLTLKLDSSGSWSVILLRGVFASAKK